MTTHEVRRRPGGRSAQVREAVLAASLQLLAEVGPGRFSVAEVAKRAGVHETSIYRRWGNRERLALDAMTELSAELIVVPDTGTLRGDLSALGMALVRYFETPLGMALVRVMAVSDDDESSSEVRAQFWATRYDECKPIIERAVARGELPEDIDGRFLIEVFAAPMHARVLLTRDVVNQALVERLADVAVKAFVVG